MLEDVLIEEVCGQLSVPCTYSMARNRHCLVWNAATMRTNMSPRKGVATEWELVGGKGGERRERG